MFWMSVLLVSAALACAYALLWMRKRRALQLLSGLPTFPALPFIGNTHQVFKNSEHILKAADKISKICEEKMLPFVFWIWHLPFVVLTDPVDIKTLSNAAVGKPQIFAKFLQNFFGDGLFSAPVSIWKHTSKKLSGAFSSSVVAGYQDVFNALAQELVGELRGKAGGAPFDVSHYLSKVTLEAICRIVLGRNTADNVVSPEYHRATNRMFELQINRILRPFLYPDFIYRFTSAYGELYKCESILKEVSVKALREKQKEKEEMKQSGIFPKEGSSGKIRRPYVDILLDLAETDSMFTTKQISDEMNTIIAGGHDTVTTELLMVLIAIGKHPVVQDKLYFEIRSIFGDIKGPVDNEDLKRMPYCEAVINETLRFYPAAPLVLRETDQDVKLNSCTIPAGSICILSLWGTGRSRRLWGDDAEQFRPERWLQLDPVETASKQAAFAIGKRSCMGKKYAMAFMKTILVHCVRELVLEGEDKDLRLYTEAMLRASEGKRYAMSLMKTILAHAVRELVFKAEAKELRLKVDVTLNAVEADLMQVYKRC